jgi:hypothetical protein
MKLATILILVLVTKFSIAQTAFNDTLAKQLEIVYNDDQIYRQQLDSVQKKHGGKSNEMQTLWHKLNQQDSINEIKVKAILDKYGWLGSNVIGVNGNNALFLVIQHADLSTQEMYLPMMKEAVKNRNAKASSLALLEDRVALRQGKKQIYGSQVSWNMETNEYFVLPLIDPDNVDKRRADVGLPPLERYLSNWNMKWDVEQYKKDLPKLEEILKNKNQ